MLCASSSTTRDEAPSGFGSSRSISPRELACKRGFCASRRATSAITRPSATAFGEARLDFGPGYRVYFAKSGRELVILLLGGDKSSQAKDIKQAKAFWAAQLKETKHGKKK